MTVFSFVSSFFASMQITTRISLTNLERNCVASPIFCGNNCNTSVRMCQRKYKIFCRGACLFCFVCYTEREKGRCTVQSEKTTVYLLRHGQSEANLAGVFTGQLGGFGLTPLGHTQAELAAVYLKTRNIEKNFCKRPCPRSTDGAARGKGMRHRGAA